MRDENKLLESLTDISKNAATAVNALTIPFGESASVAALSHRDKSQTGKIVHNIANYVFGSEDAKKYAENKGFENKNEVVDTLNLSLLKNMKEAYIVKAENFNVHGVVPGQYALNDTNEMNCLLKDAALVGLVDGQIYPTYNKVFKVHVSPTDEVKRQYTVEYVLDPVTNRYYSLKEYRTNKDLRESFGNVTPTYSIEIPVPASGVVRGNLFDIHNANMTAAGKTDKLISKDYMYIRNQVKILKLEVSKAAATPPIASTEHVVDIESVNNMGQSGQMAGFTTAIGSVISFTDPADKNKRTDTIEVTGQIFQDGKFSLTFIPEDLSGAGTPAPYVVKKVWVTITLPMIGNNKGFQIGQTDTTIVKKIMNRENYVTTFSQYFQDQFKEKTNRNLLEEWTSTVTKALQLAKDGYAMDFIENRHKELKNVSAGAATSGTVVTNNALSRIRIGAETVVDMTVFNPEFDSRVGGVSTAFAETANDMLAGFRNEILQTDNTTIFLGSDTAAYWIKNENGTHNGYLQYVGSLAQDVHGIAIKDELMRIKVGTYAGYFIVSDDPRFKKTMENYQSGTPTTKRGVESIFLIPRPEPNKETFIFGEGREYLEHTTGTVEAFRDQSLNYHTGFQIFEYNAVIGKIILKLKPNA